MQGARLAAPLRRGAIEFAHYCGRELSTNLVRVTGMTFGNHDFLLLSHQHQQALTRHAAEFRRVRRDPEPHDPAWTRPRYASERAG